LASSSPSRPITTDERAYLIARVALLLVLGVAYVVFHSGGYPKPMAMAMQLFGRTVALTARDLEALYLAALSLVALGTLGVFAAVFWWRVRVERAMLGVLLPDLVALTGFVYLGMETDAFYPICILLPVMYALVVRKREAWMVGAATAVAYIAAHALYPHFTSTTYVVFAFKSLAIPLVGALVAGAVAKQHEQAGEVEAALIANAEVTDRLGRRVSELQAVSEITEVIHSSLDFDNVGPVVLDIVAKLIDIESCTLFIIDRQASETIFSASVGVSNYSALREELDAMAEVEGLDDHFTCTSVFDRGEIMVLFCAAADDIARLSPEDSLIVGAVASELVVAVENSRLYKLTKRLAITDELTSLFNYRHLQHRLDEEMGRARRYGKHLSLLMIDVDDFKHFNDSHGHLAGDTALAELAAVLRQSVRGVDLVARYGGEEFSAVLPETDAAGAYSVAEKIREAIALHAFVDSDGVRCCQLTVSIGLATYPSHASDKESLLREADDALYAAKNGGKNRVRSSQTHLPPATLADFSQPTERTGDDS